MKEFQQRRMVRRLSHSKLVGVVALIILALMVKATYRIYHKYRASVSERALVEKRFKDIEERSVALTLTVERLRTDKGVEEEIREQFNMAKEGEEVAVITDDPGLSGEDGIEMNWWQKTLHFFGF